MRKDYIDSAGQLGRQTALGALAEYGSDNDESTSTPSLSSATTYDISDTHNEPRPKHLTLQRDGLDNDGLGDDDKRLSTPPTSFLWRSDHELFGARISASSIHSQDLLARSNHTPGDELMFVKPSEAFVTNSEISTNPATTADAIDAEMLSSVIPDSIPVTSESTWVENPFTEQRLSQDHKRMSQELVRQFIDIEALDDDDTDVDYRDMSIEDGFIDDSQPADASGFQPSRDPSTAMAHREDRTTCFIDHLERTYVHGIEIEREEFAPTNTEEITRANHANQDWIKTLLMESTHLSTDWVLFRVDCKSGSEYDILFDLMQSPIPQREVRSAFYNPSLGSHIYLEAWIPNDRPSFLVNFLAVHSDVFVSSLYCVPPEEHKSCLCILPHNDRIFSPGTWVKIDSPGLYNGDTGLVRGLRHIPGRLNIAVLLVPRILWESDKLDPQRPKLDILTEAHLDNSDMEKRTANGMSYFKYKNQFFESGLLVDYISPAMLSVAPEISWDNRRLFVESKHPFVLERLSSMPMPELWHFEEGESVSIVGEELDLHGESTRGVISQVSLRACEVTTNIGETIVVQKDHLVKTFSPGEYVKVVKGPHADTKGLIGERDGRVLGLIPDLSHSV
ncbi:hypothetical protein F5880DRAFT_1512582, partial [Lentinula raphanica]